jgi:hypothetical protein
MEIVEQLLIDFNPRNLNIIDVKMDKIMTMKKSNEY